MAKAAAKNVVMLTPEMTEAEAEALVVAGKVPMVAYNEWRDAKRASGGAKESPVSREEFLSNAKPIILDIDGSKTTLTPKMFSTGSLGWGHNWKQDVKIGDKTVKVTMGVNFTVNNSKLAK